MEKVEKLVTNLHDKTEYVSLVRNIKQVLYHGWISKKKHKAIKFSQEAWRKPHIDMNSKLRKKNKNDFKKDFFKLMNNPVFGKTVENMRKHRDIKRVTTEQRKNYLVSEPNYRTTKFFTEDLLAIEMRKTQILINKPIYLGLSILDLSENVMRKTQVLINKPVYLGLSILVLSKSVMYEFWYDYIKPKCGENAKLFYMDTESFIVHL